MTEPAEVDLGVADPSSAAYAFAMNKPVAWACLLLALPLLPSSGSAAGEVNPVSPDGQWRYECVDGHWPEIQQTSTAKRVLDLNGDGRSVPHPDGKEVFWAPDSKRFAFNYSPPHVPHSTYVTTAFYQLRGEEWFLLRSPIDEDSVQKSFAALAKHLPRGVRPPRLWRADSYRLVFKVRSWTDDDTAILYVYTAGTSPGGGDSPTAFLFTLNFDLAGKCKITRAQKIAPQDLDQ